VQDDESLDGFEDDGEVFEDEFADPPAAPASQAAPVSSGSPAVLGIADLTDAEIGELIAARSGEAEATSVNVLAFIANHRQAEQAAAETAELLDFTDSERELDVQAVNSLSDEDFGEFIRKHASQERWA
jgi:hypothetical protein